MRVAAQVVGEEASNETVWKEKYLRRSAPTSNQRAALRRGLLCGQQLSSLSRIDWSVEDTCCEVLALARDLDTSPDPDGYESNA